jgi:hypothetical protein
MRGKESKEGLFLSQKVLSREDEETKGEKANESSRARACKRA